MRQYIQVVHEILVSISNRFVTGILSLRVYAIYDQSKRVLVFLITLLLGSFVVNVAQISGILSMIDFLVVSSDTG